MENLKKLLFPEKLKRPSFQEVEKFLGERGIPLDSLDLPQIKRANERDYSCWFEWIGDLRGEKGIMGVYRVEDRSDPPGSWNFEGKLPRRDETYRFKIIQEGVNHSVSRFQ